MKLQLPEPLHYVSLILLAAQLTKQHDAAEFAREVDGICLRVSQDTGRIWDACMGNRAEGTPMTFSDKQLLLESALARAQEILAGAEGRGGGVGGVGA